MFISIDELYTIIDEYQLLNIATDKTIIDSAIIAAEGEATSYLASKYNTTSIFAATGDDRNATLVEHIKSIALYYLMRKNNVDINADNTQSYYRNAIEWLKMVNAGTLTPDLPLLSEDGVVSTTQRIGSNPKFTHIY
ncbi:MAG: phage protein Gp36 family protein [Rikenellaceae bacterium]